MNTDSTVEIKLKELEAAAEKLYSERALASKLDRLFAVARNILIDHLIKDGQTKGLLTACLHHKSIKKIQDLTFLRINEQKEMTVGELIQHLSKFDTDRIVTFECYVSCITDSGTDLGGMENHCITDITDLETRVSISIAIP